jgi:hypothetical protein
MRYQGSLRSCEPIILSEGIFVPVGIPWLASVSGHGENQGMRVMLVWGNMEVALEVSEEARKAKKHIT